MVSAQRLTNSSPGFLAALSALAWVPALSYDFRGGPWDVFDMFYSPAVVGVALAVHRLFSQWLLHGGWIRSMVMGTAQAVHFMLAHRQSDLPVVEQRRRKHASYDISTEASSWTTP